MDCGIPSAPGLLRWQPDPDWNDLSIATVADALERCTRPTISRVHPSLARPCERRRAGSTATRDVKQVEASIIDKAWDKAGHAAAPKVRRQGGGLGRPGLATAQQLARAGHRDGLEARFGSAPAPLRHPDSRWRSGTSTAASTRCGPRGGLRPSVTSAWTSRDELLPSSTRSASAAARPGARLTIPGASWPDPLRHGVPPLQNKRVAGDTIATPVHLGEGQGRHHHRRRRHRGRCLGTVHRQGCKSVHQFEIVRGPPTRAPRRTLAAVSTSSASPPPRGRGRREYAINTRGSSARTAASGARDRPRRDETDNGRPSSSRSPARGLYPADLGPAGHGLRRAAAHRAPSSNWASSSTAWNVKAGPDKRTSVERVFTRAI